ncbi:MAG: HAMP domain-containing protein [Methylophaga sp.]|nr:HAMP domain-containing protein [Methylophaga sp.]
MNLKLRINLIITVLLFLTLIIGGGMFTIQNARGNVQAEIASTAILALHMLDSEILAYSLNSGQVSPAYVGSGSTFQLNKLTDVRHLKIDFYDAHGRLRDTNQSRPSDDAPPKWFVSMMDTVTDEMPITKRMVYRGGRIVGELVITPDPSYEIAEVWEEMQGMLIFVGIFFIVVNILIYYFVGRALRPIDNILEALTDLESGKLEARLPKFTLPELSRISDKFNVMANTLEESIADNRHLTQQMIQVQEEERKNLARELHDEIGQHLTAIHVDASAILKAKTIEASKESASAIDTVARQMMDIVHNILQRLRPSGLDELGLEAALQELINGWKQRHKDITVKYSIEGLFSDYDEAVLITLYRLVQECLTNISRHARAENIQIILSQKNQLIFLSVSDDGQGFDTSIRTTGFGLPGMRERVEGLAGVLEIVAFPNKGTQVNIELPCITRGEK